MSALSAGRQQVFESPAKTGPFNWASAHTTLLEEFQCVR